MVISADHHDLSVVRQAQTYQITGKQKSGPLQPVKRCGCTHHTPLPTGFLLKQTEPLDSHLASKGRTLVKGKHANRGASFGLGIPCKYCCTGDKFSIQWLKSKLGASISLDLQYGSNKLLSAQFLGVTKQWVLYLLYHVYV